MSETPKRTEFGFEPRDPFIGTVKITAADIVQDFRMTPSNANDDAVGQVLAPEGEDDQLIWVPVVRRLVVAARTSGGTAGPDAELMAACEQVECLFANAKDDAVVTDRQAVEALAAIGDPEAIALAKDDAVEAVARAIWPLAEWNGDYQEAVAAARAAIEAMRAAHVTAQEGNGAT